MPPRTLRSLSRFALILGLVALAAPAAHAGDLKIQLSFGGKHGKLAVHAGHGYGGVRAISGKHGRGCAIHERCVPGRQWVPGHYETVAHEVWIPESRKKVWVPPLYETRRDHCGRVHQVLVRPGTWSVVCEPGHFATRRERIWVPGYHRTGCATY